jgi:hypothetical protein
MLKVKPNRSQTREQAKSVARHVDEANVAGRPIELRVDGFPALTVADPRARRLLWQLVEHIETLEAVREGLEEVRLGKTMPLAELDRQLRKKHGIPG